MKQFLLAAIFAALLGRSSTPEYAIQAIRYASSPGVPVSELVVGGPKDEKVDIAMVVWLIRGGGHAILFDSGFHRDTFLRWRHGSPAGNTAVSIRRTSSNYCN
ncbi:MAG: hypothetical protein DMG53_20410 [Acidobacteria bacterium]|nr:MAG: hypothetical protein DMG53_20410 [Acidobacteriota bacterium]